MMLTAIAIDDEPLALEVVRSHAAKVPFLDLKAEFTDAFKAMEFLQHTPVDLLFLDIKMPDISGIDLLNCLSKKPLVIFTTAYPEHAVDSFELDAIDYLLKPFSLARFMKACNKAAEIHTIRNGAAKNDHLFLKTGYEQIRVSFEDICYLEATGNYINFVLQDKAILSRMGMSEVETMLPGNQFIRIHRSFIAALNKIDKIERHQIHIKNHILPIGKLYADNLLKRQI